MNVTEGARNFKEENGLKLDLVKKELRSQLILIASAILPLFLIFKNEDPIDTVLKYSILLLGFSVIFGILSVIFDYFAADIYSYISHNILNISKEVEEVYNTKSKNINQLQNLQIKIDTIEKENNKKLVQRSWFYSKSLFFLISQVILFLVSFIVMLCYFYKLH